MSNDETTTATTDEMTVWREWAKGSMITTEEHDENRRIETRDEARELARRWPWSLAPHEKSRLWTLTSEWMANEKRHGRIESDLGEWLGRDIDDAHTIAREAMEANPS